MKNEIFKLIQERGHVSFAELSDEISGFNGDLAMTHNENTVLWAEMSKEAITAIRELVDEKKIVGNRSSVLVYFNDGKALNFPIAKQIGHKYKKLHWLPMTFSVCE